MTQRSLGPSTMSAKRLPSFFREWQLHQRANLLAVRLLTTAGSWPGLQVGTVPEGRSYHENV